LPLKDQRITPQRAHRRCSPGKLATLATKEGFDDFEELVALIITDSLVAGICITSVVGYTTKVGSISAVVV